MPRAPGQRLTVWTLAGLSTVSYGTLYYSQPLLAVGLEQAYGWTRTQTSSAFTLALLTTALLTPAVGRQLDRGHGRRWLGGGALLGSGAFLLLALSSSYLLFVVGWLLAGVAMSLTFYEAVFTVLGQQVAGAIRSRATLTVTLIAGLASTLFVPLTTALLGHGGLRLALLGLSSVLLLAGLLSAGLVGVSPPAGSPSAPQGSTLCPRPDVCPYGPSVHPGARGHRGSGPGTGPLLLTAGRTPAAAAVLTGLMGLDALPGRAAFMPLLVRLGAKSLTLWLLGLLGISAVLLHFTTSDLTVAGGTVAVWHGERGSYPGPLGTAGAAVPPELFGTVNGLLARPVKLSQALTPFGMGVLFAATGG